MKVVALVSGGKDSCFAMMRCIDYGHEIVALANLMPADDSVDELDSYMYQTVGHQIVSSYVECMGLPLFRRRISGSTRHQSLNYIVTEGDEVEDMFILLSEVKKQIPSITAVSSGAIASDYQRLRVESVCSRLGLVSLAYLWKQDQTFLLEEMIRRGIVAIIIKVAALGLNPSKHLGKELAELQPHLLQLKEVYGINVCGEGGEYETLTLDCSLFVKGRILLDKFKVMLHSPDNIAPVGILHPLAFHLEQKKEALSCDNSNHYSPGNSSCIHEVKGSTMSNGINACPKMDLISNSCATKNLCLSISRSRKDLFSLGCWAQKTSDATGGLHEDLTAILRRVELQLNVDGFGWSNVLYIHLYVSSMKDFALANEVYLKFITEKKCHLGVPSRSTIELPLLQVGLGSAYVEVLVANDQSKRVLHVQSISCWAPSCIGPYSQATLHKQVLYMAGQLGLDPPTMMICTGGAAIEIEQALKNCEAVANSFNSSLVHSAALLVVYCSASLTSSERNEIQQRIELFMQSSSNLQNLRKVSQPISLYILAPALPKGALVEVKPVLYIPGIEEDEPLSHSQPPISNKSAIHWDYKHIELYNPCYQTYTISGKLLVALVSITEDLAAKICNTTEYSSSENHMIEVVKFCTYIIDKILLENDFVWEDLLYLKFYYTTKLAVTSDFLETVARKVFAEFAESHIRASTETNPIFNLIPILCCGTSASMENIITCEIFASKV